MKINWKWLTLVLFILMLGVFWFRPWRWPWWNSSVVNNVAGTNQFTPRPPPVEVLTYHNDNARTGLNSREALLTRAAVGSSFHLLSEFMVDGYVFTQPLYKRSTLPGLVGPAVDLGNPEGNIPDLVFVATANNTVYAVNVDTPSPSLYWSTSITKQVANIIPVQSSDLSGIYQAQVVKCLNIVPQFGIIGTPVIDDSTSTLYVVAKGREPVMGDATHTDYTQYLLALDLATGSFKFGSPKLIARTRYSVDSTGKPAVGPSVVGAWISGPTVFGNGESSTVLNGNQCVFLDALRENQRAGLVLANGVVYVTWTAHCDCVPYHGWVVGFDRQSLNVVNVFNTTPNATTASYSAMAAGGIWQAGAAPAADASGALYFATGNGVFDVPPDAASFPGTGNYGDSVLKLVPDLTYSGASPDPAHPNGYGLAVADFFTPNEQATLQSKDLGLGSGGVVLLPDQPVGIAHPAVLAGKEGKIYLLNRDTGNVGKYHAAASDEQNAVTVVPNAFANNNAFFGVPAYFNQNLYFVARGDVLKQFPFANGTLGSPVPATIGTCKNGATPSISANGTSDGIVWVVNTDNYNPYSSSFSYPELFAYNADDMTELYDSEKATSGTSHADRPVGTAVEFTVPTIADGHVYFGTANSLAVYGIK